MNSSQTPLVNAFREVRAWPIDEPAQDRMIDGLVVAYVQEAYGPAGWIVSWGEPEERTARAFRVVEQLSRGTRVSKVVSSAMLQLDLAHLESLGAGWLDAVEDVMGPAPRIAELPVSTRAIPTDRLVVLKQRLDEVSLTAHSPAQHADAVRLVSDAFQATGAHVVTEPAESGRRRIDVAVWTAELEQIRSNPLLVEVKTGLQTPESLARAAACLSAWTPEYGTWTLIVVDEGNAAHIGSIGLAQHVLITESTTLLRELGRSTVLGCMKSLIADGERP